MMSVSLAVLAIAASGWVLPAAAGGIMAAVALFILTRPSHSPVETAMPRPSLRPCRMCRQPFAVLPSSRRRSATIGAYPFQHFVHRSIFYAKRVHVFNRVRQILRAGADLPFASAR